MAAVSRLGRRPLVLALLAVLLAWVAALTATGALPGSARTDGSSTPGGCASLFAPGDTTLSFVIARRHREAVVHVSPVAIDASKAAPLMIAIHGWASGARAFAASTGLSAGADSRGAVVAYLQGLGEPAGWNIGGRPETTRAGLLADIALFDAVLDRLVGAGCVDPDRVFVAGHSQGGGMAAEIVCSRADALAGAALISPQYFRIPCRPAQPIPVISLHAVDDEVLPYVGGHVTGTYAEYPPVLPAEEAARTWATYNGCADKPAVDATIGVTRLSWTGCGAPVVFDRLTRGGHAWTTNGAGGISATLAVWTPFSHTQ